MKKLDSTTGISVQRQAGHRPPNGGRLYSSDELMGESHEILIAHAGTTYRLRRTANGKLILTK